MEPIQGNGAPVAVASPTCMESVNRISKLPVVESTIQTATNLYEKVKDYNSVTNWTLQTAENTVNKAVEVGKPIASPVIHKLEGPIKKVDDVLCSGLDYVESKVPSVKLPPGEIYNSTKDYVHNTVTPAVESAYAYAEPAVTTARGIVEPAVQSAVESAKHFVEPAIEQAKSIVEPAIERAAFIKKEVMARFDELAHQDHCRLHHEAGGSIECEECKELRKPKTTTSEHHHHNNE